MEKEQKQEFGWSVSVLPIPAFHCLQHIIISHSGGMQERRKKENDDFRFFFYKAEREIRGHICTQEVQGFP